MPKLLRYMLIVCADFSRALWVLFVNFEFFFLFWVFLELTR